MFISVLELFKIGIGPSSSHTMGPMLAAGAFRGRIKDFPGDAGEQRVTRVRCVLKGSLAFTGKGHSTDLAVILGLHGYTPKALAGENLERLMNELMRRETVDTGDAGEGMVCRFNPREDVVFDTGDPLPQHPNGMIFELLDASGVPCLSETYFSIGGGFIHTAEEIACRSAPQKMAISNDCPYAFDSAAAMIRMAGENGMTVAEMKRRNELAQMPRAELERGLDEIWHAMRGCLENGLRTEGVLPGGLDIPRRAAALYRQLHDGEGEVTLNDWLCAYAMAVNEENAAGHTVVTAPTNGAAGVIPAVLYYLVEKRGVGRQQIHDFLLTAAAIGGLIKYTGSISGAEVGCQGEVGSAAAMAAAGICAARGGDARKIENAAEIALEHHLGMTCDPVKGLVQVPCIERNGFGAIKAYTAASLAMKGTGQHFMPLDNCIAAMMRTGMEMSHKYKETSLGGLAVSLTEC